MSSPEEAVASRPPVDTDNAPNARRQILIAQLRATVAYLFFSLIAGLVQLDPRKLPDPHTHPLATKIVGLAIMILPTAIGMFLQLALIWNFVKQNRELNGEIKWAAVASPLWLLIAFGHLVPETAPAFVHVLVTTIGNIALSIALTMFGAMISRIIREPKILLPIGLIAGVIDIVGAMTKIGFTQHKIKQHPEVVSKVSVQLPAVHVAGGFTLPTGQLGPADILFLAFFFAVVIRHWMNHRATFGALYGVLTPVMIGVTFGFLPSIAALAPMGIAVIAANWKYFKYSREENFAMLYAGLICIGAAIGFFMYTQANLFTHHHRRHGTPPGPVQRVGPPNPVHPG